MIGWPIQKAVYQKLIADTALMAKIVGVYDAVPQGTAYPYISIGEDTSLQWDTDDSDGVESTLTLHAWSRQYGRRESKEIMDLVHGALHRAELQIDDADSVFCHFEFSESFMDPDGVTRHGVMRYRIVAEEAQS